jgi:hypothetical protein
MNEFSIGTLSHAVGKRLAGYSPLPEWNESVDPEFANLRYHVDGAKNTWASDPAIGSSTSTISERPSTVVKPVKKRVISLDDFLDAEDEVDYDSSSGEEEGETPTGDMLI